MKKSWLASKDIIGKMETLMKEAKTASEVRRIQSVLLGAKGMKSPEIVPIVGYEAPHIRRIWKQYRKDGEGCLLGERRGQVRGRAHLSLEEEDRFLKPFLDKANEAGILFVSDIQEKYEKAHEMKVFSSVIYNLLHRHGWRKITPRPSHPKANKEKQEEFLSFFPSKGKRSARKSKNK